MPTDLRQLSGPKQKVATIAEALVVVRRSFPRATMQGSLGSWSFWQVGRLVGEAWLHRTEPAWWLRVKAAEAV